MQPLTAFSLIAFSCTGLCFETGSPVEKVVKLLTDLQEKAKADGANEKAAFEKFECWCTGMTSKKGKAIEEAKKEMIKTGGEITSLRADVAQYSADINNEAKTMKETHESQQEATKIREKENAAFTALRAEMGQALQSLNQALKMLNMAPQFLQTSNSLSTEAVTAVRSAIDAIPERALGSIAPAKLSKLQHIGAALAQGKYDPSYGSIVNILEEMYKQFSTDLEKETTTETTSNKDYEDLMDGWAKEIKTAQETVDNREEKKAKAAKTLAKKTEYFDATEAQRDADIKFFEDAVTSCENKAGAWKTRQEMRNEELEGVAKAIEILTSDAARELFSSAISAGGRSAKHVSSRRDQVLDRSASFLQIDEMPVGQQKAFKVLKEFATKSQSVALAKLAAKVRLAQGGHFDAVLGAIDTVIGVLKTEQKEDNDKKKQCNDEYQSIARTSNKLDWKIEKNNAAIDKLENTIANREEEKANTIQAIKDVTQEIEDLKDERAASKQSYDNAKKEDEDAVDLLNQAKNALTEFYENNGIEDALGSLIQQPKQSKMDETLRGEIAPETKFSGKASRAQQSGGIVKLMQMIIEGLEDEIRVGTKVEEDSIKDFDKTKKAAEDLKERLENKRDELKGDIADLNGDKDDENTDLDTNTDDLKSETDYKAKIQPDCDFTLKNWQSRFEKRKAEMDGLTVAKDFLSGASLVTKSSKLSKVSPH